MLDVQKVDQFYGSSHTLRGISLTVKRGECMALLGRNGVGKTTLLKCLMGVQSIASGSISFEGADISKLAPHARAKMGMAYVPQGREIFARLTVEENILMGMATKSSSEARNIQEDIFELFPVLRTMLSRRGGDLSGGQQQQLAIARALVAQPKLIIFDEPTEGIQPSIIKDIAKALNEIRKLRQITIVVSEQVLSFAMDVADRLFVIEGGRLVHETARADTDQQRIKAYLSV